MGIERLAVEFYLRVVNQGICMGARVMVSACFCMLNFGTGSWEGFPIACLFQRSCGWSLRLVYPGRALHVCSAVLVGNVSHGFGQVGCFCGFWHYTSLTRIISIWAGHGWVLGYGQYENVSDDQISFSVSLSNMF